MSKTGIIIYLFIVLIITAFSTERAESFDPDISSKMSIAIAEWELINEEERESQGEGVIYIASSLAGKAEIALGENVEVIKGLAAFTSTKERIRNAEILWAKVQWVDAHQGGRFVPLVRTIGIEPSLKDISVFKIQWSDTYRAGHYMPHARTVGIEPSWKDISVFKIQWSDAYWAGHYMPHARTVGIEPSWKDISVGKIQWSDLYRGGQYMPSGRDIKIGMPGLYIQWSDTYTGGRYVPSSKDIQIGPFQWSGTYLGGGRYHSLPTAPK